MNERTKNEYGQEKKKTNSNNNNYRLHICCYMYIGGKLVYQYQKKPVKAPRCGDCGVALPGVRIYYYY